MATTVVAADRRSSAEPVQVSAHTREGGKVQVDAYTRGAPRSGPREGAKPTAAGTGTPAAGAPAAASGSGEAVVPQPGRLPTPEELEELPKALTVEAARQAEPGTIRRVVLDAQVRATAFMALLGKDTLAQKLYRQLPQRLRR